MVTVRPLGMASRALTARFISICSNWPRSASTGARSASSSSSQRTPAPMRRKGDRG